MNKQVLIKVEFFYAIFPLLYIELLAGLLSEFIVVKALRCKNHFPVFTPNYVALFNLEFNELVNVEVLFAQRIIFELWQKIDDIFFLVLKGNFNSIFIQVFGGDDFHSI
jgi:hypothetical protein